MEGDALRREASELARKLDEVASYHIGSDLVERIQHALDGQEAQRVQMRAAAAMITRLLKGDQ